VGKKFWHWLEIKVSGEDSISFVGVCLVIGFLLTICASWIMATLGIAPEPSRGKIPILVWWFPLFLFVAALVEELLFRFPLVFYIENWGNSWQLFTAIILFSIIFGAVHGSVKNIFLQGVFGFIYSLIFLKCGGLQGRYVKALCMSTLAHVTTNGIIALILLANGIKTI